MGERIDRRTAAERAYDDYVDPRRAYRNPWGPDDDAAAAHNEACRVQNIKEQREAEAAAAMPRDCRPMIPASAKRAEFQTALADYAWEATQLGVDTREGRRKRDRVLALYDAACAPVASEGVEEIKRELHELIKAFAIARSVPTNVLAGGRPWSDILMDIHAAIDRLIAASQRGVDSEPITPTDLWKAYESTCVMYCTHVRAHRAGAIKIAAVQAAWQEVERAQAKAIAGDAALGRGGEK